MVAEATANPGVQRPIASEAKICSAYFRLLIALTLTVALASFVRERGQLFTNISFWTFLVPFALSLWRIQVGFLAALFLLTVTPSLHEQLNVLAGSEFHAWAYPGIDCCLGFLAAWTCRGGLRAADDVLDLYPSSPLLLFHAWMTLSAVVAVGRNIWQSASEFSIRGFAYNVWLTRGISWHDDYYPLQDPFFYGIAVAMVYGTWVLVRRDGERLLRQLVGVVLTGAVANVAFALWQKSAGKGWVNGTLATSINAFWPDLHSFGVFMAMALILACGTFVTRREGTKASVSTLVALIATGIGVYLSGSRSTLLLVSALLVGWTILVALKTSGRRRVIPIFVAIAVIAAVHWTLDHGYRDVSYSTLGKGLSELSVKSLNDALSYRPEIWAAAFRMYSTFPFFGLGQGAFYRLGADINFSRSGVLVQLGGDGVHNELLRILVELGPIGLALVVFILIPFVRLGRQNFRFISFYALAGIALGNLYTNALLVRELLTLTAVFAGAYFFEAHRIGIQETLPSPMARRTGALLLVAISLAAAVEVALSLKRFPFTYGKRCMEVHVLAKDKWTTGAVRLPIPSKAVTAELTIAADRSDLARRPLDLIVSVFGDSESSLSATPYRFTPSDSERVLQLPLAASTTDGKRLLELKPSHCYVPLNLGKTYDPRRLGVRVKDLRFFSAAGLDAL